MKLSDKNRTNTFVFKIHKKIYDKYREMLHRSGIMISGRWIYLSLIIGIFAALGAALFMLGLTAAKDFFLGAIVGYKGTEITPLIFEPGFRKWLIIIIPAFGGLISGLLTTKFAPDAKGHGTDYVIKSFHKEGGGMKLRVPIIKLIATSIIIGTGGSAGREGPIAQIGAGIASNIAAWLKFSKKDRRIMLIAGAGAGISAIFSAPLGGSIFACEVLYKNYDLESEAIIPSVISSIVSFSIFRNVMGMKSLFVIPPVSFDSAFEIIPYAVLGVICALLGVFYVKAFNRIHAEFVEKLRIKEYLKPALGGFFLGVMALFLPEVLGGGYEYIQMSFNSSLPLYLMFILIFAKIAATSFTIGSGGSGGIFAPSLFIGAMLGSGVGALAHRLLPGVVLPSQAAFAVVGMGGFFAGVARVPLSSLILVSEMTKGYDLLVPMMLVSAIAFLLNRKPYTLYDEQAASLAESPAHKGEFETDILENMKVNDAVIEKNIVTIPRRMPLDKVVKLIMKTKQEIFPVVDMKAGGKITGMFSFKELREHLMDPESLTATLADDIANGDFIFLKPDDDLHYVMDKFLARDEDALPVMDVNDNKLLGLLTRTSVINSYNKKFLGLKKPA